MYCIARAGHIIDHANGNQHAIAPGTLYALDEHDQDAPHAEPDMRMVCGFNPPVVGPETQDDHGGFPLLTLPSES